MSDESVEIRAVGTAAPDGVQSPLGEGDAVQLGELVLAAGDDMPSREAVEPYLAALLAFVETAVNAWGSIFNHRGQRLHRGWILAQLDDLSARIRVEIGLDDQPANAQVDALVPGVLRDPSARPGGMATPGSRSAMRLITGLTVVDASLERKRPTATPPPGGMGPRGFSSGPSGRGRSADRFGV